MLLVKALHLPNGKVLDLDLRKSECYVLQGKNGSGKSLLLRSLAFLAPVTYSSFLYKDRPIEEWKAPEYRSEVLYLASTVSFDAKGVVEDFFEAPKRLCVYQNHISKFDHRPLLKKWDLEGKKLNKLSSGQRQLISFLRALTLKAEILLLDEPTSHVDFHKTMEMEEILLDWKTRTGGSFLLVSHQEAQAKRLNQVNLYLDETIIR